MGLWDLISSASLLLLGLAVFCFLLYCVYIHHIHLKYDHIPGPPRDSFFMGHAQTLMKATKNNKIIHDCLLDWVLKYGTVIRLNSFHKVYVIVANPEGIKELLMSSKHPKDRFYENLFYLFGVRFMGQGLLTDRDYEHWHRQRRLVDPAFSRSFLINLMGTFNDLSEDFMEKLSEMAEKKSEIKMHDMFSKVALDILAKAAFDLDLKTLHDNQSPFPRAIQMGIKGMGEIRNPLSHLLPSKRGMKQEVREAVLLLRKAGSDCLEERQKNLQEGAELPGDILTQILKGGPLEEDSIKEVMIDNVVTMLIAGQETIADLLAFAVQSLAQNPEILKKAKAEVDEVIGSKRDIGYEDLAKLPYLSQVLKETLRLYPSVPGTGRLTAEEIVVEGVRIPKNTSVLMNTYVTGRMEQFFPDPLIFNPNRFSPDAPKPYYTYFPFSLGPRSCLGQVFAQMEARVIMAKFLQRFDFKLVAGQNFAIWDIGTLRPKDGMRCYLKVREKQ